MPSGRLEGMADISRITTWLVTCDCSVRLRSKSVTTSDETITADVRIQDTVLVGMLLRQCRYLVVVTDQRVPRTILDAARRERDGITMSLSTCR